MEAASSSVVIKVKYGEMLRRLNASVIGEELDFTVDGLRERIRSLFNLSPDVKLILTYIDEDGDVVHLVDADDLRDVVKQRLNPLRITVQLGSQLNENQSSCSTGGSTPLRSPQGQIPLQNLRAGVTEILKTVPGPLRETLANLSSNLTSEALSSSPQIAKLVDTFSKVGMSYLVQPSDSETGVQPRKNNEPENSLSQIENGEGLKKVEPKGDVAYGKLEIRNPSLNKIGKLLSRSRCMKTTLSGHGGRNLHFAEKEKINKNKGCYSNENAGESANRYFNPGDNLPADETNKPSESHVEPKTTHPDPMNPSVPSPTYVCPFSGLSSGGTGAVFHCGVRCDGCGIHPITGPRFKSKVKLNYDLCSICFSEMGNSTDYIRMDRPAVRRNHVSPNRVSYSACSKSSKLKPRPSKLNSRFLEDVNVFDGTFMAPSTSFTKKWRMRNNGTVEWPLGTRLNWIGGEMLRSDPSADLEIPPSGVPVDKDLVLSIDFVAPECPGQYISIWRMSSPSGQQFGQRVWVLIQVDASVQATPGVNISSLNLNLPPVSSSGIPKINSNPSPVSEDTQPQSESNKETTELVEPLVEIQPDTSQEMKFPINNSLLVGSGALSSFSIAPSDSSSFIHKNDPQPLPETAISKESISDPCAGLSVPDPIVHVPNSPSLAPNPTSPQGSKLLGEFEEMNHEEIDVNKEIPRMNEYNLDQAKDDLCDDISDWDPILEELQEMGFQDTEMNKMLLEKNRGSITRVVMDLVAGEKKK